MRDDERTIVLALRREAERAPLVEAPPPEVIRRVKRRRAARAGMFAVSVGIVVGVVAAALVALSPLADRGSFVGGESPSPSDVTVVGSGVDPIAGRWTLRVSFDEGHPTMLIDGDNTGGGFSSAPIGDNIFGGYSAGTVSISGPDGYSFDVQGVVSARAARVTLTLADGTELEASLFPIPPRYFGDAKAYVIFGDRLVTDARNPGRTLTAYDEDGTVLDTQSAVAGPDEPGGTSPEVDGVMGELRKVRDALSQAREVDPFADFDLATLRDRLPEIPLNTSATVVSGAVSVRVMDARHAVLVATAPEAPVMCLAVERDANPDGGWNFYYGLEDAQTYDACRGGWDPFQLPPT